VCKESATADDVRAAMPHPVAGSTADPIALEPPSKRSNPSAGRRTVRALPG
jgi:hypothetical protein